MKPAAFFDLDGLLADFVRGIFAIHGNNGLAITDVRWGLEAQLGIDPVKFWEPLGYEFWKGLQPYEDGMKLLQATEWIVGPQNIGLLTSPCQTKGCIDGKRAWVKEHLDDYSGRLFVGSAKHLFAGPGKILVDDNTDNVNKFTAAGGRSVLVPRPWNVRSSEVDENGHFDYAVPLEQIRSLTLPVSPCSTRQTAA